MKIQRRHLFVSLMAAGLSGGAPWGAWGQPTPGLIEGTHYTRLKDPVPVAVPGKIEVIEFFWYGCPHCSAFEPTLDAWQKSLPADVAFRRVPIAFREEPDVAHQRLFYALDSLGLVNPLHRKVFDAIHVEHLRMNKPEDIAAWMTKNGVDGAKFLEAYQSFSVQTKANQARALSQAYKIEAVPAIAVGGRYTITGAMAGGNERMPLVANVLIQRMRQGLPS